MFTARHYEAVAAALHKAFSYCETDNQRRGIERARNQLAQTFEADNPRFNRQRFFAASTPPLPLGQRV